MSAHASKNGKDEAALRIVMQHRDKESMIYELSCKGIELEIRMFPLEAAEEPSGWRLEARPGRALGAFCVTESAATRSEALRAIGQKWASSATPDGLPVFDWDAVARALADVRAL